MLVSMSLSSTMNSFSCSTMLGLPAGRLEILRTFTLSEGVSPCKTPSRRPYTLLRHQIRSPKSRPSFLQLVLYAMQSFCMGSALA